ncbi:formyltransferase family protein [Cytobacillus solani]|uniref:Methionyl-tRNA formyltransferase n=1 Tax=Cytobacillus solani TaxID=1637975 RepID=A0A0Q3QUP6_9BACI|nr:formyltransferase family protein [Cytobacillus solani]KQL21328.1 hypothetical protein AN957_24055 [Cytobacillus solani]
MQSKLILFLMNEKGYYVLKNLLNDFPASKIKYVISNRDKNISNDYFMEIKQLCLINDIPFLERDDFKNIILDKSKNYYRIAIGWRWILDETKNLIILHDSLLPKYRGFSPLVTCLINNEKRIGVTALFAAENYDEGNIIHQLSVPVTYPIKIKEAINKINPLYYSIVKKICSKIFNNERINSYPQDNTQATYSLWRGESDYSIDWSKDSAYIQRFVDAVGEPFLGASSLIDGNKVRILDVELMEDLMIENRDPGKVIFIQDGFPVVVCGKGLIKIKKVIRDDNKTDILPIGKFRIQFE